jgi:hypothetical protein
MCRRRRRRRNLRRCQSRYSLHPQSLGRFSRGLGGLPFLYCGVGPVALGLGGRMRKGKAGLGLTQIKPQRLVGKNGNKSSHSAWWGRMERNQATAPGGEEWKQIKPQRQVRKNV